MTSDFRVILDSVEKKARIYGKLNNEHSFSSFFAKFLACFYYVQSFSVPWARMLYTEKSSNMAKKKNNSLGFVLNLFLHGNSKTRNPEGFGFSICRVINLVAMSLLVKVTFS